MSSECSIFQIIHVRASTSEWIREISISQASIDVATPEETDFPLEEGETEIEREGEQ